MGAKASNNYQSNRPESGGADKDMQREKSGCSTATRNASPPRRPSATRRPARHRKRRRTPRPPTSERRSESGSRGTSSRCASPALLERRSLGGAAHLRRARRGRRDVFGEPRHQALEALAAPGDHPSEDRARQDVAARNHPSDDGDGDRRRVEDAHSDPHRDPGRQHRGRPSIRRRALRPAERAAPPYEWSCVRCAGSPSPERCASARAAHGCAASSTRATC